MGDKDSPLSFNDMTIFIDGKELNVVENSVELSTDDDTLCKPIPRNQLSFKFHCDASGIEKLLYNHIVARAQVMLDAIKEELTLFCCQKPPHNRKERRERGREIIRHIERFKRYCRENHIELKNKP